MTGMTGTTARRLRELLTQHLHPTLLEVQDDSAAHAGHRGNQGKGHFRVRIVSEAFDGLRPLQRHRLVNQTLAPLFETDVHALTLETLTPEEIRK